LMKSYSALIGRPFLKKVLATSVERICKDPLEGGASFEIDPNKMDASENLEKNRAKLQNTCSKILRTIFDSIDDTPFEFRQICHWLQKFVSEKFPESAQLCIGGFLFLRFFCPAIVTPVFFGLIKGAPSEPAQRGLTLAAKVLQNIANNVPFGSKEDYLTWMNDMISSNFSACQDYFDEMAKIPEKTVPAEKRQIATPERLLSMENLYKFFKTIKPKLDAKYQNKNKPFYMKFNEIMKKLMAAEEKQEREIQEKMTTNRPRRASSASASSESVPQPRKDSQGSTELLIQ